MLNKPFSVKQTGITLVELLIAMAIGIVLILGLVSIYQLTITEGTTLRQSQQLNQELITAINLMAENIRRAGYWGSAQQDIGTNGNTNPFMSASTDITINAANNCILFAYDSTNSGTLPAVNSGVDDKRYGFRLLNGAIQYRPVTAAFSCTAASNTWLNITSPNQVTVSALTFTLNSQPVALGGSSNVYVRTITISLTGYLTGTPAVTRTLTTTVKIANDKVVP